jgi:exodeoxyribonuclease V beta subunit
MTGMNQPDAHRQHTPQPLAPLDFPLTGRSLIEASAGTGKTFTIAMLYVRLVLGHDPGNERARPLTPPEILVVTFTDAATKELRDRIRARLTQAARYFQASPEDVADSPASEGDLLHELRAQIDPHLWPSCARRLQFAAEWMDEAAVSTIHSWCNRMLREHAFDSDSLFSQTLETDQTDLFAQSVRDYWRTFLAPLDAPSATLVAQWAANPAALQKLLRGLVDVAERLPVTDEPEDVLKQRALELEALKAPWKTWPDEIRTLLDEARAAGLLNGRSYQRNYCEGWLGKLTHWARDPLAARPDLLTGWERITASALKANCNGTPPSHPGFDALDTLRDELGKLERSRATILAHAARWVAARFDVEQARRAQMAPTASGSRK